MRFFSTMTMTTSANKIKENLPGVLIFSARLTAMGETKISNRAPIDPPMADPMVAWPMAFAPRPLRIIGYPSIQVISAEGAPGMLMVIAVMLPE
ncbi:hypothetical protein SDC9_131551 [bioreactor metagenome]|uniref:Uncharacterized protein n=1 Tax=bioreactor metagenome TaxID=1076179 RepID=A0A645D5J1_9ZZZZ